MSVLLDRGDDFIAWKISVVMIPSVIEPMPTKQELPIKQGTTISHSEGMTNEVVAARSVEAIQPIKVSCKHVSRMSKRTSSRL
jgi:hypothetical protein